MIIDVQCLNIPAGVPTHRYDDTSCVLVTKVVNGIQNLYPASQ